VLLNTSQRISQRGSLRAISGYLRIMASPEESLSELLYLSFFLFCAEVPTFRLCALTCLTFRRGAYQTECFCLKRWSSFWTYPWKVCVCEEGAREQERGSKRERMCQCVKESADYLLMYTCIDTSRVQISICPGRSAQAYCRTLDFKCVVDMCLCIFFFQMHFDSVHVCVLLFVRMWANGRHQKEVGKGRRNRPPR